MATVRPSLLKKNALPYKTTLLSQTTFHLQVAKHYVIKLVGDLLQFGGFLLRFLPPRYNWNIVESGIKHH